MPKTKHNSPTGSIDDDLAATTVFELLANDRRRFALHYLSQAVGSVPVSDLADQIALWEGDHTRDRYERICTGLVHVHLPKLVDAGVAEYDADRETVELLVGRDQIVPHLDLTAATDIP